MGRPQFRSPVDLEGDNLTASMEQNLKEISGQALSAVDIAQKINDLESVNTPNPLAEVENDTTTGANADILNENVSPSVDGAILDIRVTLGSDSVFKILEDIGDDGAPRTHELNEGGQLSAGAVYEFSISARSANSYNFRVASDVDIRVLSIVEKPLGGAV
jgi:hypothetical protein